MANYEFNSIKMSENRKQLEEWRSYYNSGEISEEGFELLLRKAGLEGEDADYVREFCQMSRLEMETNPYYKSDLSADHELKDMWSGEFLGQDSEGHYRYKCGDATITVLEGNKRRCESETLGDFEYDAMEFEVGFYEIQEDDGSVSQLPVLKYDRSNCETFQRLDFSLNGIKNAIGNAWNFMWNGFQDYEAGATYNQMAIKFPEIPEGVKSLDYTFAGKDQLEYYPKKIPDSVTSMHCAFAGCTNLKGVVTEGWGGELVKSLVNGGGLFDKAWESFDKLAGYDITIAIDENGKPNGIDNNYYIYLPENLKDMSGCFMGCKELQGELITKGAAEEGNMPTTLVNAIEAFEGCEAIDDKKDGWLKKTFRQDGAYDLPKLGAEFTPALAQQFAKDAFAGISDNGTYLSGGSAKAYDATEYLILEDGSVNPKYQDLYEDILANSDKYGVDIEQLKRSQGASAAVKVGEVLVGHVWTMDELASDHMRSDNKIDTTGNGDFINDETGLKKSMASSDTAWWEGGVAAIGIGAGLSGLFTKTSESKVIGIGLGVASTFALSKVGLLPKSVYPVFDFVHSILPEGTWKEKFGDWVVKTFPEASVQAHNSEIEAWNNQYDQQFNVARELWDDWHYSVFGDVGEYASIVTGDRLAIYMGQNAKACAGEMMFAAAAVAGESLVDQQIGSVVGPSVENMKEYWATLPSNEAAESMQNFFMNMMTGIQAYSKGAVEGLEEAHGVNGINHDMGIEGLAMTNRAYVETIMPSLLELDKQYHFMKEDDWKAIEAMDIQGVDVSMLRTYDANTFAIEKAASAQFVAEHSDEFAAANKGSIMEAAEIRADSPHRTKSDEEKGLEASIADRDIEESGDDKEISAEDAAAALGAATTAVEAGVTMLEAGM